MRHQYFISVGMLALALSGGAFAQTSPAPMSSMPGMTGNNAPMAPTAADKSMQDGMTKMQDAMQKAPMNGNPDHDFASMMIPHHQGAIDMAETELKYGKDPTMRALARSIVAAQKKEIAEMRRWMAHH